MVEKLDRKKLEEHRISTEKEIEIRKGIENSEDDRYHILVCGGTACESNKSEEIVRLLKEHAEKNGIGESQTSSRKADILRAKTSAALHILHVLRAWRDFCGVFGIRRFAAAILIQIHM